ncbi:hypothetical protein [Rhizobium lentis]|uniref:Uncharacterized protein n=1 Tax=Rhizobium lentis TaxID=1138194 RepID=A0A7W8UMF7_9HYPH|nr:hypothetical protein [Rhizobium lentis]MBB4574367.1 hypothetical protein [Rhizobium lentis]MBB5550293.1 hypothetical protein [Rhizobium lentis]MBB5560678.1 hypothetical protein [Rhizobium lentis]MBB5567263.1 hypothetical protein [Rhizobium lentis]
MRRFLETPNWNPGYMNVAPQHTVIMAECTACGARQEFMRERLPANLRQASIRDVEKRLKCSSCGAKAGKLRFGSFLGDE